MSGLVSSVLSQEIGTEERLRNDLFCVEWDVKPLLSQSVSQSGSFIGRDKTACDLLRRVYDDPIRTV